MFSNPKVSSGFLSKRNHMTIKIHAVASDVAPIAFINRTQFFSSEFDRTLVKCVWTIDSQIKLGSGNAVRACQGLLKSSSQESMLFSFTLFRARMRKRSNWPIASLRSRNSSISVPALR